VLIAKLFFVKFAPWGIGKVKDMELDFIARIKEKII